MKYLLSIIFALAFASSSAENHHIIRVVTLAPNLTKITHLLIKAAHTQHIKIVGVIHYPGEPSYSKTITGVGSASSLNVESILQLNPDIVLASPENNPISLKQIQDFGTKVDILNADTLNGISTLILEVGSAIKLDQTAQTLSQQYLEDLKKIKQKYQNTPKQKVFVQLSEVPIFTIGASGTINEIITLCQGQNIFSDIPYSAFQVSTASVLKKDPDFIFQLFYNLPASESYVSNIDSQWQSWANLAAVYQHHIYKINPNLISQNTPNILAGAEIICKLITDQTK